MAIAARALQQVRRRRAVVLGYHGVAVSRRRDDLSMLLVAPDRFRAQIELLLAAGFRFVTLAELARQAAGGVPPAGLAALTFDDGMRNNYEVALPILAEYSIPATVYVTIGFIDGTSPWIAASGDGAMMTRDQLRELLAAGWELGAHTMTHPDLSTLDYDACLREVRESRIALEEIGGKDKVEWLRLRDVNTGEEQRAQRFARAVHELAEIGAGLEQAFDEGEDGGGIALDDGAEHLAVQLVRNEP